MGWADFAIRRLQSGNIVTIKPKGNSMSGRIESGDTVVISPICDDLKVGDIVLCCVKGNQYLHFIKGISRKGYLIGNNHGKINGWTRKIYGKFLRIDR